MIERRGRRDGFTLIEVLIVVAVIGLLAAAIAAVFTIIVRTTPSTEARTDDARSLLGVTTWISSDASSTPQVPELTAAATWNRSNVPSGCSGTDEGSNVLRLRWEEQLGGSPTTYTSSFRLVDRGDTSRLIRVSCVDGGSPTRQELTADLPPVSAAPLTVDWKTETRSGVDFIVGVEVEITTIDGDTLRVDGASYNPAEGLNTNNGPIATPTLASVSENTPVTFNLNAIDPDGDSISATITGFPAGWAVSAAPGTIVSVTLTPTAGVGTYVLNYTVTDGSESSSSTIEVTVSAGGPPVNSVPVAGATAVSVEETTTIVATLNATDADPADVLTVSLPSPPAVDAPPSGWIVTPTPGAPPTISIDPVGAVPGVYSFGYTVTDGTDTSPPGTVTVTVTPSGGPINTPPTAALTTASVQDGDSVTFTLNASDTDPADVLTASISGAPAGWTVSSTIGSTVDVTIDTSTVGPGSYSLTYTVSDGIATSASAPLEITVSSAPCSAAFSSSNPLDPNPVEHDDTTNGAKKVAQLLEDVTINIVTSGDCADLRLRFFLTDQASSQQLRNFGDPNFLVLQSVATERWQRGAHLLELVEIPTVGPEIVRDTATLNVVRDT